MKSISVLALATLALCAPVASQSSILPYLPKETVIAITAPDLGKSIAEFQKMPLAKMWAEEEVQNFVADLEEMARGQFDKLLQQGREMHTQGQLPVDPDELLKLRMRGITVAITHLELSMPDPKVGLVVHLDFGDSEPQWQSLIQLGIGALDSQSEHVVKTESKVGDWQMLTYASKEEHSSMGLNVVMVPKGLLIGTLAEDVRSVAENMQKKTPQLTTSADMVVASKHLPTDNAELVALVRWDPLVEFGVAALHLATEENDELKVIDVDGIGRALTAMGLRDLPTDVATSSYVEGKCLSRSFRACKKASTTEAAKTIDMSFLKWVPKDAVGFSAGTFDALGLYDKLLKGLQAYDSKLATDVLAALADKEKEAGCELRKDLFGSLGDHYVSWSMPMGTITSAPEVAFLLKVTDEARFVKVLKALAQMSNGMVSLEENEKRGIKVYQLHVNFDPTQGRGGVNPFEMLTPTISFKSGYLVGGFSANDIKRVFQRMDREDDPKGDIRSNREFAAVADHLPPGLASVSFTDWKSNFESMYQIATGLLALVPMGEEVPLDMSLLPDSASLTKHLFGSISYSRSVEGGEESESISPFGPELAVMLGGAVGAGVAMFGLTRTRHF